MGSRYTRPVRNEMVSEERITHHVLARDRVATIAGSDPEHRVRIAFDSLEFLAHRVACEVRHVCGRRSELPAREYVLGNRPCAGTTPSLLAVAGEGTLPGGDRLMAGGRVDQLAASGQAGELVVVAGC